MRRVLDIRGEVLGVKADGAHAYEVVFGRGRDLKFISHLDLMRVWERLLRRARLPVAHSQGFNPRPSLTFAAPLPVGVLSSGDLLQIELLQRIGEAELVEALRAQAVSGLEVQCARLAEGRRRSLPARMQAADYEMAIHGADPGSICRAVGAFLAADTVPIRVERGRTAREFDLRPLVLELAVTADGEGVGARLRHSSEATGRPDDLLRALGFEPARAEITRCGLVLAPP